MTGGAGTCVTGQDKESSGLKHLYSENKIAETKTKLFALGAPRFASRRLPRTRDGKLSGKKG